MTPSSRIAIVGAGNVGATAAYALMLRGLFSEIVLIDRDAKLAEAQAIDIADANAIARPARVWAGDYADVRDASVLVLTAGAATHGDETRVSIAGKSAAIVRDCVAQAMAAGFAGILVVAANPVDAMAQVAQTGAIASTGWASRPARWRRWCWANMATARSWRGRPRGSAAWRWPTIPART
jgi:L-lactate dehydrogenase